MNIIRDPRWGRAQESVSEDPYLNGLYASSFVKGLQGDVRYNDSTVGKPLLAAATCKHLAVYNLEVVNYNDEHWTRHRFQANVTAQELEETYLPAFKACIMEGKEEDVPHHSSLHFKDARVQNSSKLICLFGVLVGNSQQIMCSYNSIAVTGGAHPYNSTPACLDGAERPARPIAPLHPRVFHCLLQTSARRRKDFAHSMGCRCLCLT